MKPATQPDRGRCSWCGGPCRWIATDSPWEFVLVCPAGCQSVLSWAHADPPPAVPVTLAQLRIDL